jgi:integrase/recombinase XerC
MFGQENQPSSQALSLEAEASFGGFLLYAETELRFSPESLSKYSATLRQLARGLPERPLAAISRDDLFRIKARFIRDKLSDSWLSSTLLTLKAYLTYLRDFEGRTLALDLTLITPPKRRRREVLYLNTDEVARLVGSIQLRNADGSASIRGLRLRALVEMLLGSGLRISELLSIDRKQIDPLTREAKIIGKGNRERPAYFTPRALEWLDKYLAMRDDDCPALFVDLFGRHRMQRADIWRFFAALRKRAGIEKQVTPHILRHTAATQLLFNGCPIGHIKEILGHARLETTCRYYLGVDHRAAKEAHGKFLHY